MKVAAALEHFGTKAAIADALNIRPQSVGDWGDDVPSEHSAKLVVLSGGEVQPTQQEVDEWSEQIALLSQALKLAQPKEQPKARKVR